MAVNIKILNDLQEKGWECVDWIYWITV